MIHLHHSEEGFCGSSEFGRQFSFEIGSVTCPHCRQREALVGLAYAIVRDAGTELDFMGDQDVASIELNAEQMRYVLGVTGDRR